MKLEENVIITIEELEANDFKYVFESSGHPIYKKKNEYLRCENLGNNKFKILKYFPGTGSFREIPIADDDTIYNN